MQRLIAPFATAALSQYALALSLRDNGTPVTSMQFAEVAAEHGVTENAHLQFAELFAELGDSDSDSTSSDSSDSSDLDVDDVVAGLTGLAQKRGKGKLTPEERAAKKECIKPARETFKAAKKTAREECKAEEDKKACMKDKLTGARETFKAAKKACCPKEEEEETTTLAQVAQRRPK